jgi:hypothetical protein
LDPPSFATCLEVDDVLVEQALTPSADLMTPTPRARVRALLLRMYQVAEPNRGAPRILLVLARLARCPWLEGLLVVRLRAEGDGTRIDLLEDDGISSERFCPATTLRVPFREFSRAVQLRADLLVPLIAEDPEAPLLVLRASSRPLVESASDLQVADRSLLRPERQQRPPPPVSAITWSQPSPSRSEPATPPEAPRRAIPADATTRIPAQQAAELIARIKLKKQAIPAHAEEEPPSTRRGPEDQGKKGG